MDGSTCFQAVCGGFFLITSLVSLVGTLVASGACDDCTNMVPMAEIKALLCPPRTQAIE